MRKAHVMNAQDARYKLGGANHNFSKKITTPISPSGDHNRCEAPLQGKAFTAAWANDCEQIVKFEK